MEKEQIIAIYRNMVGDGFCIVDQESNWECRPYSTAKCTLTCDDGTRQDVWLVLGKWNGKYASMFWRYLNGKYVEDFVCYEGQEWKDMLTDDVLERVEEVFQGIVEGGQSLLKERIETEGIEDIHSLVVTDKPINGIKKLPYTCALSFYGQVFAGVEELNDYCVNQKADSSPYILKRCHDIIRKNEETGENETIKCTNYLVCNNAKVAKAWLKEFVGMGDFSVYSNYIPDPWQCPPMICYAEGERYMLLVYREGSED
jgi:hypothetical protein